jgi:phosphatidylserine/phosphatidylglycerophosphate/cardiolipin synthase-like enzyme
MASYGRIFDSSDVSTTNEVEVRLADPTRTAALPIVRPDVARYAGERLLLLDVSSPSAFPVSAPVNGIVRRVALDPATPLPNNGGTTMLELVPVPFSVPHTHRGSPTFYIAPFENAPVDDERVDLGDVLTSATRVWIAARFQDSFCASAADWIHAIGESLPAEEQAAWLAQLSVFGAVESLRVTDHVGAPVPTATFTISLRRDDDRSIEDAWERAVGDASDLSAAVRDAPLIGPSGTFTSLYAPPAGRHFAVRWTRVGTGTQARAITAAIHSVYPSGPSAAPGVALRIAPGTPVRRTLQVLAIEHWFAATPARAGETPAPPEETPDPDVVPMFRANSRVEPLVDGTETFRRLAEDLDLARRGEDNGVQLGAYFTGLKILDFPLVRGRDDTKLTAYAADILANGGSILVLPDKWLNLRDPNTETLRTVAAVLILTLTTGEMLFTVAKSLKLDVAGAVFTFTLVGASLGIALLVGIPEDEIEPSAGTISALNALLPPTEDTPRPIAIYSRPPMRLDDNPLTREPKLLSIENDIDQFGFWHDKVQLVRRSGEAAPDSHVAYVGGIDVNGNRLDTPSHQGASTYHDVHARLSGPIVADAFTSFVKRWELDALDHERRTAAAGAIETPAAPGPRPTADDLKPPDGDAAFRHIARIGRTYYKPKPGVTSPLDFAPEGERTVYDTLMLAIASAQQYIYIEDQYFTPNDEFVDALVAAASRCRRLVVIIPTESDQYFGDRRRRMIADRLGETSAWGDRFFIGCPMRRPVLAAADRITGKGRCVLAQEASPSDDFVLLFPPARVPKMPAWLWIDGELMLARRAENTNVDGKPASRVTVVREAAGRLIMGTKARSHFAGAPVTCSSPTGIFVHAKCMMIDDAFVSIGSTNLNRRGFFHDGELNVFAIPEALRSTTDNPARALRTALWSEQLGLPPVMGALLGDVTSAYDLFLRSRFITRAVPYDAVDVKAQLVFPPFDILPLSVLKVLQAQGIFGLSLVEDFLDEFWDMVVDPTSFIDPNPQRGPFL